MTTPLLRVILVPVDFGPASARAVAVAGRVARHAGAELRLVHAESAEAPAYFTHEQIESLAAQRRQLQAQAQAFVSAFGRRHTSTPFTARIDQQPPAVAVLQAAGDADLVVMGTHGRRGPSRWWLGSVTERVLRDLDRPLMVLHAGAAPDQPFERVDLYGQPEAPGDAARGLAATLAAALGAPVVDHVAEPIDPDTAHDDTALAVIAAPAVPDRHWLTQIAEPLIRSGAGAVVFVPQPVAARVPSSVASSRRIP